MSQHELLIINQSAALGPKALDGLQRKGFSISSSTDLASFSDLCAAANKPILLIHCSERTGIEPFIDGVCNEKSLTPYPLIVLALELSGLETKLNKIFPLAVALQLPAEPSKIIEAVRFIERNYRVAQIKPTQASTEVDATTEDKSEITKNDIDNDILYSNQLFLAIKDYQLNSIDLGGASLPLLLSGRSKGIANKPNLPQSKDLQEACQDLLSQAKAPIGAALERINIITLKILSPLKLEPEVIELAKAGSILFAQSFAIQNRSFLTRDYSFRGAVVLRKEICSAIKDSALNLGSNLSDRDLSRMVACVAKIVGQEDGGGDNQLSVSASAIVAADLLNRLCFEAIYWNASAAYRLLRRIRQGKIKFLHPAVCCIVLKLLAEALSGHINMRIMTPKKSREDIDKLENSIHAQEETVVDLPRLTAGMKLSRPLRTEDGRDILAEDLVLDDDLIMRIWQLSAIRLLDKAVIKRVH